jgi:hypothetical protein
MQAAEYHYAMERVAAGRSALGASFSDAAAEKALRENDWDIDDALAALIR